MNNSCSSSESIQRAQPMGVSTGQGNNSQPLRGKNSISFFNHFLIIFKIQIFSSYLEIYLLIVVYLYLKS